MSRRPPILDHDALPRESDSIHTFSNGTEWEGWASGNCLSCKWYDWDQAGASCAFEGAALLHRVSPELATQFGWTQTTTEYGPRDAWEPPARCPFFKDVDDDSPDPPIIDPTQITFLAPDGWPVHLFDPAPELTLATVSLSPESAR